MRMPRKMKRARSGGIPSLPKALSMTPGNAAGRRPAKRRAKQRIQQPR
jgi:hypothetical protein